MGRPATMLRVGAPRRRVFMALTAFAALATAFAPAAAGATAPITSTTVVAPTTTTTTTTPPPSTPPTTEAPPPPAFLMGYDAGPKLLTEQRTARHAIAVLGPRVTDAFSERNRLRYEWTRLLARLADTEDQVREAQRQLDVLHREVTSLAAQAYTQGSSSRVTAAVGAVVQSDDIVQASRDLVLLDRVGVHATDVVDQYRQQKNALDQRVRDINAERVDLRARVDTAAANYDELQHEYKDALQHFADANKGLEQFRQLATTSASPILGPSFLKPEDLAAFVTSRGYHPHLTVGLVTLARLFIQEANKVGVRGDVAWAQSILETGFFTYPGAGSLVNNTDNNYAGVGACDSCAHGFVFPNARIGARAQMQLLRTYVDKSFTAKTSKDPLVLPRSQRLGFRGKIHSWWDLGHHWATGANYGDHLYAIYMQMVTFAKHRTTHS